MHNRSKALNLLLLLQLSTSPIFAAWNFTLTSENMGNGQFQYDLSMFAGEIIPEIDGLGFSAFTNETAIIQTPAGWTKDTNATAGATWYIDGIVPPMLQSTFIAESAYTHSTTALVSIVFSFSFNDCFAPIKVVGFLRLPAVVPVAPEAANGPLRANAI